MRVVKGAAAEASARNSLAPGARVPDPGARTGRVVGGFAGYSCMDLVRGRIRFSTSGSRWSRSVKERGWVRLGVWAAKEGLDRNRRRAGSGCMSCSRTT